MAITTTKLPNTAIGITYSVITDSSVDWTGITNSTYFYDKDTNLPYYKNASGTVISLFEEGGGSSDAVTLDVQKDSSGTINVGDVVRLADYDVGEGVTTVELVDPSTATTMPAIGIATSTINQTTTGTIVTHGKANGLDTSLLSLGDVYVSPTSGELTNIKPTGTTLVQKFGQVTRVNASNGEIIVFGAGRENDLPNLPEYNTWVGDANGVPTEQKNNYGATTAPTATDDSAAGYEVGSVWIDTTNNNVFTCSDATASAAVWVNTGSQVQSKTHTFGNYSSANYTESFAHGLGSDPDSYKVELECTSANLNYAVGDKIQLGDGNSLTEQNTADRGYVVITDGTNVTYIQAQHTSIVVLNKTTGAWGNATYANGWRLKITAYKFGQNVTYEDPNAIHDNVAGEIVAITEKTTPVDADLLIIEDSAASNAKKKVQIGNLPDPTLNKTFTLDAPTASDDVTIFRTDVAITVQEVIAVSVGTTPSTTYQLKHSTDRNAAGNNLTNSATTTSTTTGNVATLSDATIPADSWIWFESTAASGTNVMLTIDIRYTED